MRTNKGGVFNWGEKARLALASGFLTFHVGSLPSNPNEVPIALAQRILDLLTTIAFPIAFFGIVTCAFVLLSSRGNPEAYNKTKKYLLYLVTGVFIILFASLFLNFMRNFFAHI